MVAASAVGIYFSWYDLKYDYYFRKATMQKHTAQKTQSEGEKFKQHKELYDKYQAQAKDNYKNAKQLYEDSVSPFQSLKANYEAGLIALNINHDAENAKELLAKVRAIDPA